MNSKKYFEMFEVMIKSKLFKTFLLSFLILLNFILAGVSLNIPFVVIVILFSYLGVAGILFRKSERQNKFFSFLNFIILLQKGIGYLFVAVVVIGVLAQLYFKFK